MNETAKWDRVAKWDQRFLEAAELVASWSKDPSTQCGAVVARPDMSIASWGFNGFPMGCSDDEEFYGDRDLKYDRVIHAEMNAILLSRESLHGYTMYTWPPGYGPSCARCSAHIIQAGISAVVFAKEVEATVFAKRWKESSERGLQMYAEAGVRVTSYPRF